MFKIKKLNKNYNRLYISYIWIVYILFFDVYNLVKGDITKLAINECLIFSSKSLDLIECTNEVVSKIVKDINSSDKNINSLNTCLKNPNYERSIIGLSLSFGSGDNLEYNKVKCPRLIAAFLRDRIFGYSCPYLSGISELFTFRNNKDLKTEYLYKRKVRTQSYSKIKDEIPTILTSLYTKLIQSCDKIELCLYNRKKIEVKTDKQLILDSVTTEYNSRDYLIKNYIKSLPEKIGRQDTITYANDLLRRVTLEYEINIEKESPLDPFWLVQAYRMLFVYSMILNSSNIFVNINPYYIKKVFNFLIDMDSLKSINSLQLQSKLLGSDNISKNQHLFLRASYAILESCFNFWEELHQYYSSLQITNNRNKKTQLIDVSQICQNGLQLSLRQTIMFFYYSGIRNTIEYENEGNSDNLNIDNNEFFESSSLDNIYVATDLISNIPWFIESSNIFFPINTLEDLNKRRDREISILINQSQPKVNPKATVLYLNYNKLSGYFVGGNGSMMYKSCTYYLKKLFKKNSKSLILAKVTKMSKQKDYKQVDSIEKIRHFCWYSAKESYPNDSSFERENKYENRHLEENFDSYQSRSQNSSQILNNLPTPKRVDYHDIKEISPKYEKSQYYNYKYLNKTGKQYSFLDERRKEILKRLYPQSSEIDIKSLVYSVSDKLNDLKGVPVIKHYSSNIQFTSDKNNLIQKKEKVEKKQETKKTPNNENLLPKLLQEIKFGVKLKPTGSSASAEILKNIKKEITSNSKNENLGISSSQIKSDMESTEFSPPIIETSFLDELSNNQRFLFEQ